MKRPSTAQNIALSVTVIIALVLLLLLHGIRLSLPKVAADTAKKSQAVAMPDFTDLPDEEMFIEPKIMDVGDLENTEENVEDALTPQGEPEVAEQVNDRLVVNGPNPVENPSPETLVASSRPNKQAQTSTPSTKDTPDKKITAPEPSVNVNFKNGKTSGKGSTAQSGNGNATSGQARGEAQGGRKLLNNPTVSGFNISKQITVTVTVQVKADGSVVAGSANVLGLNNQSGSLKSKLKAASEQTRWTPKKDAPTVQGTLYWTLIPGTK